MLIIFLGTIITPPASLLLLILFILLLIPIQFIRVFLFKVKPMSLNTVGLTCLFFGILLSLEIFIWNKLYPVTSDHRGGRGRAQIDIKTIGTSLELFKAENYYYPTTKEGLDSLVSNPNPVKYKNWRQFLKKPPLDPWGNTYEYLNPGLRSEIDIYSLGPDGIQSKDDIGNWDLEN